MAVSLGEAILKIGADSSTFERKLMRLKGLAKHHMDAAANAVLRSARNIMMAGAAGIAAGFGFALKSAMKTAEFADAMGEMADRTGFATKTLTELKYAGDLTGTSIEAIEKGIKRMQVSLYDARSGMKTAVQVFKDIGLSIDQLKAKTPEQVFEAIIKRLADIKDANQKAALAAKVFGRAGTELLPMLANGYKGLSDMREEANRLGLTLDGKSSKAAADFQDNMDRLKASFTGAQYAIGNKLIPVLDTYAKKATAWISANRDLIAQKFDEYIRKISDAFLYWMPKLAAFGQWVLDHYRAIGYMAASLVLIAGAMKAISAVSVTASLVKMFAGLASERAARAGMTVAGGAIGAGGAAAAGGAGGAAVAGVAATVIAALPAILASGAIVAAVAALVWRLKKMNDPDANRKGGNSDIMDNVSPTSPAEKARRLAMLYSKRGGDPNWFLRAYGGVSTAPFKAPFGRPGDMGFPQGALERIFAAGSPEARARAERNRMLASYDALNAGRLAESKRPVQRVLNPATGRMELPQTPGGMSVNIQTINVTADSVGDAKRFEQMLVNRAHAAMP